MQNEQDLEKLVHAHTAALLRYCTGLLGCEADAQDAVQKTFIKAWQQRHTLRHDGTDNERAWLYRIAYRTSLDMLRAAKRAAAYPHPGAVGAGPRHQRRAARGAEHAGPAGSGPDLRACAGRAGLRRTGVHSRTARRLSAHTLPPRQKEAGAAIEGGGAL